ALSGEIRVPAAGAAPSEHDTARRTNAQATAGLPAGDHRDVSVHDAAHVPPQSRLLVVDRRDMAEPRVRRRRTAVPGPDSTLEPRPSGLAFRRGGLDVQRTCEHLLVLVHPAD